MSQRWERQKVLSIKTVIGFNSTEYIYIYIYIILFYQLDTNVYWVIIVISNSVVTPFMI